MAAKYHYFTSVTNGLIVKTEHPEYYQDVACYHALKSKAEGERLYVQQQRAQLTADLQAAKRKVYGDEQVTVYAVIRKVSASGMKRTIDFYLCINGEMQCITYNVATVLGLSLDKDRGLIRNGCGMDMVYDTVDSLWRALGLNDSLEFRTTIL
jgi:hypothetical protein